MVIRNQYVLRRFGFEATGNGIPYVDMPVSKWFFLGIFRLIHFVWRRP